MSVAKCVEGGWPEGGIAIWDEDAWERVERGLGVGVRVWDGSTANQLRCAWERDGGRVGSERDGGRVAEGGEGGMSRDGDYERRVVDVAVLNGHGRSLTISPFQPLFHQFFICATSMMHDQEIEACS